METTRERIRPLLLPKSVVEEVLHDTHQAALNVTTNGSIRRSQRRDHKVTQVQVIGRG